MWGEKIAFSFLLQAEEGNFFSSYLRNLGPVFFAEPCKIDFLSLSQDASSNVIFIWSSEFFWKANITADVIALLTEKLADDRQIHIAANICIWELEIGKN